jgi:hypothetical protein
MALQQKLFQVANNDNDNDKEKLITRLFESAKQDLTKLESSKKERIQRLASELASHGVIPTDMICDFITSKLHNFPGVNRSLITKALDAKYKSKIRVEGGLKSKSKSEAKLHESLPELYIPKSTDYDNFDVRDCQIESWEYYPDMLKKRWVIQLIEDKQSLQYEIIALGRA